jgi:hypothetical protein
VPPITETSIKLRTYWNAALSIRYKPGASNSKYFKFLIPEAGPLNVFAAIFLKLTV